MKILRPAKGPLRGRLRPPGDKSISHRSVMMASVSHGTSKIEGFLHAADTLSTVGVFRALGVPIEIQGETVHIIGKGPGALRKPAAPLDCGNSGTTMRLMTGLLAGIGLDAELIGDASLTRRPMKRVSAPLNSFGADVRTSEGLPPVIVGAGGSFRGGRYDSPIASAQVKSSLLLAGLMAGVPVEVEEPTASRDHTETIFRALGVAVESSPHYLGEAPGPASVRLPAHKAALKGVDHEVPADISSAAFLAVAAAIVPDSDVTITGCGVAPTRAGLIHILDRAIGGLTITDKGTSPGGEPEADLRVCGGRVASFEIRSAEVPTLIDEIPALAILAGQAHGRSTFRGIGELRVKESDRLERTAKLLRACGVKVETGRDWMNIDGLGGRPFEAFEFDAPHDHRMAGAAAVAALMAKGPCTVRGLSSLDVSYPSLLSDLESLQTRRP